VTFQPAQAAAMGGGNRLPGLMLCEAIYVLALGRHARSRGGARIRKSPLFELTGLQVACFTTQRGLLGIIALRFPSALQQEIAQKSCRHHYVNRSADRRLTKQPNTLIYKGIYRKKD
jgi:hypothetical protein